MRLSWYSQSRGQICVEVPSPSCHALPPQTFPQFPRSVSLSLRGWILTPFGPSLEDLPLLPIVTGSLVTSGMIAPQSSSPPGDEQFGHVLTIRNLRFRIVMGGCSFPQLHALSVSSLVSPFPGLSCPSPWFVIGSYFPRLDRGHFSFSCEYHDTPSRAFPHVPLSFSPFRCRPLSQQRVK